MSLVAHGQSRVEHDRVQAFGEAGRVRLRVDRGVREPVVVDGLEPERLTNRVDVHRDVTPAVSVGVVAELRPAHRGVLLELSKAGEAGLEVRAIDRAGRARPP
jgi:hypothetical protein